jgi:hypothetical protein
VCDIVWGGVCTVGALDAATAHRRSALGNPLNANALPALACILHAVAEASA